HWAEMRKGRLPYIPNVPTGWDATARCRNEVVFPWAGACWYPYCGTFTNAVPELFEKYLRDAKAAAEADPKRPGAVYIYAWNEYTEGGALLPNVREGDLMLRCVGRVFGRSPADKLTSCTMKHWWDPAAKNGTAFTVDAPTHENLKYGPHMRQSLDVWLPPAAPDAKTPVLINIHGGGWSDGDRLGDIAGLWAKCRKEGIALVSISYRMVHDAHDAGIKPPVKACLDDAVAAIEFVKAHAAEWRIDVGRVGLTGGSAGACSSLYASLQGDCALGIRALLVNSPQTSIDPQEMKAWIPNSNYGAHAFGYASFGEWLAHRADCLDQIEAYSPAGLLRRCTAAKAPVFLYACGPLPPPGQLPDDPTHAAMFCVKFEEICRAKGIVCRRGADADLFAELKR
ncbi:MAG: alpha/beta hydrolase fold domain-containing protein, partial [Kiritimatiellia bacterium]